MRKYISFQVAAVLGARSKHRVHGKPVGEMTVRELGFAALTTPSQRHQLAAVAELVARLEPHNVAPLLRSLPVKETNDQTTGKTEQTDG